MTLARLVVGCGALALASMGACSSEDEPGEAKGGSSGTAMGGTSAGGSSSGVAGGGRSGGNTGGTGVDGGEGGAGAQGGESGAGAGGASGESGAGGAGGASCEENVELELLTTPPATLAETGLYAAANAAPDDVAPYVQGFRPEYELWSDGAEKRRWAYIPRCAPIDTSDMDHWNFPVGTRFWKEFRIPLGASGAVLVETRFIHRYGPGIGNWILAAYQWDPSAMNPTAADATHQPNGVVDANGTSHDIPAQGLCNQCHVNGLQERILGFSALQLSHSLAGATMATLSDEGRLSVPARNGFDPPGDAVARAALGYLHANCGNCHNSGTGFGGDMPSRMRLSVENMTVEATDTYRTMLGVPTANPNFSTLDRIEPCDPQASSLVVRMGRRAPDVAPMPLIGTEVADTVGMDVVSSWIDVLPANSSMACP